MGEPQGQLKFSMQNFPHIDKDVDLAASSLELNNSRSDSDVRKTQEYKQSQIKTKTNKNIFPEHPGFGSLIIIVQRTIIDKIEWNKQCE